MFIRKSFIYNLVIITTLISSCTSSKLMTKEIQSVHSSLGYELTSQEYTGNILADIYLNSIEGADLIPRTHIEKKRTIILPFILINYLGEKFETSLGEASLDISYIKFLNDALTTECNSSANFNLLNKVDSLIFKSDREYLLDIKINKCLTTSLIKLNSTAFLWVNIFNEAGDMNTIFNDKVQPAITELQCDIILSRNKRILYRKSFSIKQEQAYKPHNLKDTYSISQACIDNMGESLSIATKRLAEEVSSDLSLFMDSENQ